jgi:hypothetical protein
MLFLLRFDIYILFTCPLEIMRFLLAIVAVVLAINDKYTLLVKTCQQYPPLALMATLKGYTILLIPPTVASRPHLFSPFDINVKENMIPLSCCSNFSEVSYIQPTHTPLDRMESIR